MGVMTDFYILCDCLDDDLDLVARIIHANHHIRDKLSRIKDDIEEATTTENCGEERLQKYHATINKVLDMPHTYIKLFKAKYSNKGLFD